MVGPSYVDPLLNLLFEKDLVFLDDQLKELIERNHAFGNPMEGFLFRGNFHTRIPLKLRAKAPKKLLHPSLYQDGEAYYQSCRTFAAEKAQATQGLQILLRPCNTAQDTRDALPDAVAMLHPDLASLPRLKEPGWPFRDRVLQLHQYRQTEELLEFYVANRILY